MVSVYYAFLSPNSIDRGFDDIRFAITWIDGPVALCQTQDSLHIRRGDGGEMTMQRIALQQPGSSAQYAAALLLRFDLEHLESAALAWDVLIAVSAEQVAYDLWNAAYPAHTIAKCAELRPLKIMDIDGYVMRPSELECLAERIVK